MQQLLASKTFCRRDWHGHLAAVDGDAHRGDGAQERGGGQDEQEKVIRVSHSSLREGHGRKVGSSQFTVNG